MVKSDEPFIGYIKISGSSLRWRLGGFLRGEGAYMRYVTEAEEKPTKYTLKIQRAKKGKHEK